MIFTPDQVLCLADLVREHEPTDIHLSAERGESSFYPDLHADLYRDEDSGWRVSTQITWGGHVTTYGPGVPA